MKNLKEKIKEVQDYFKLQILNGDYRVLGCSEHTLEIKVDKYVFVIWFNKPYKKCEQWTAVGEYFIQLDIEEMEGEMMYELLLPKHSACVRNKLIREKEEELNKLKESL